MKKEVNPIVLVAVLVLAVAGGAWFLFARTAGGTEVEAGSMPMPKEAAQGMAQMQQQLQQQRGGGGTTPAPGGGAAPAGR
ncbi:MAG: hypothetical protein ACKO5K_12560 [Armatimonadota bacterium]